MKQRLGPRKERRIANLTGRPVLAAYTRGSWTHGVAEVWFKDSDRRAWVPYAMPSRGRRKYMTAEEWAAWEADLREAMSPVTRALYDVMVEAGRSTVKNLTAT